MVWQESRTFGFAMHFLICSCLIDGSNALTLFPFPGCRGSEGCPGMRGWRKGGLGNALKPCRDGGTIWWRRNRRDLWYIAFKYLPVSVNPHLYLSENTVYSTGTCTLSMVHTALVNPALSYIKTILLDCTLERILFS